MDTTEKFKNYLELEMKSIKKELNNYRSHRKIENWNLDDMVPKAVQYWFSHDLFMLLQNQQNTVFGNFSDLSNELCNSTLRNFECFQVLQQFIKQNIKNGVLEDRPKECFRMMNITYDMLEQVLFGDFIGNFHITQNGLKGHKLDRIKPLDMKVLVETHKKFKEHYLDKQQTYTRADIIKMVEALYDLGIEHRLCASIEIILRKNLEKREQEKKVTGMSKQESSHKESSIRLLTDKEYKSIIKEIKEYYNEYTGAILKPMLKEDIIRIASKMIWVGYTREAINQFYQDIRRGMKIETKDTLTQFVEQYDKLEYYSKTNLELQQLLKEAITYLYETFGCFQEDYAFWYQEFQEVLLQMNWKIPNTFDYEYKQAKNLFEQEKQKKKN